MLGRFGFLGNIGSLFGTGQVNTNQDNPDQEIVIKLPVKKRFQERLDDICFPHDAIPEEFCCKISYEIMDNPMVLDNDRDHDHIIDKVVLDKLWADVKHPTDRINPFTQSCIRLEPQLDVRLQQEIEKFISEKEHIIAHTNHRINHLKQKIQLHSLPRSNAERALSLQLSIDDLPSHFVDNMLTGKIMTYPVILDGYSDHIVDLIALLDWWEEDKANKNKNPYTCDLLRSIKLANSLHDQIESYLTKIECEANTLSDKHLEHQIAIVMAYIDHYQDSKSCHQRLIDANLDETKFTKKQRRKFIAQNFIDEIMTHPVKLDGKDVIDYNVLNQWWMQDKKNLFKNHYTGKRIKSIEYDGATKELLEQYIASISTPRYCFRNSSQPSWIPVSQHLKGKHAFFKHQQPSMRAGLLNVINQHQEETNPRLKHTNHATIRE